MKSVSDIVLKILGILLLTAAILKGWQLLTEPLANKDIWSYRPLLIFTVEFELALALWLLSGLFKKAAWLTILAIFSLFSLITLYKGLSGADSCGCFGAVKVNPWITLLAIDLPAMIALLIFRPQKEHFLNWPSLPKFATTVLTALLVIAISTPVLALNEPAKATSSYEVLEPETWTGKRLPILDYIDLGKQLEKGNWVVLFYHHDCPECQKTLQSFLDMLSSASISDTSTLSHFVVVDLPPQGTIPFGSSRAFKYTQLRKEKTIFAETPFVVFLSHGVAKRVWKRNSIILETILQDFQRPMNERGAR